MENLRSDLSKLIESLYNRRRITVHKFMYYNTMMKMLCTEDDLLEAMELLKQKHGE